MAVAIALSPTTPVGVFEPVTVSITGASASTQYITTLVGPSGRTYRFENTSNGSGAFSFIYTPQTRGTYTISVRPRAEWEGTTTAAATATGSVA